MKPTVEMVLSGYLAEHTAIQQRLTAIHAGDEKPKYSSLVKRDLAEQLSTIEKAIIDVLVTKGVDNEC